MHKPRKMTMGTVPILDFRGLCISHPQGHGELGLPHACRVEAGAGSDHDGTRNMSRAINLLYLFRYQIGGDLSVHKFTNEIYS